MMKPVLQIGHTVVAAIGGSRKDTPQLVRIGYAAIMLSFRVHCSSNTGEEGWGPRSKPHA